VGLVGDKEGETILHMNQSLDTEAEDSAQTSCLWTCGENKGLTAYRLGEKEGENGRGKDYCRRGKKRTLKRNQLVSSRRGDVNY